MGGRLWGVEGGSLGVLFRRVAGVLWWNFSWLETSCELRLGHGGFLGKFEVDPSWVMWKDFWLEILDGPRLRYLEGWLVGIF